MRARVLAAAAALYASALVHAEHENEHSVQRSSLGARDHLPPMSPRHLVSRQDNGGANSSCINPDPQNTVADRINLAFNSSGPGYIVRLCQGREYYIDSPIVLFANGQEISTEGYPIEQENGTDLRATLFVNGPVAGGQGHTTAIAAQCNDCSNIKIRHLRINGTRGNSGPTSGGANIEIGGPNSGQIVEYVKSFDSRSWSCLHVFEGALNCRNTTIRYNDIGPCGSDYFLWWADGISVACADSYVHGNWVYGATDGGIVLFGSPGTLVENNTIWVGDNSQIGGINMVDVNPWNGNYSGTIVRNNTIIGGFATTPNSGGAKGDNNETAILKVGIAIGPRTWFGPAYLENISFSGTVLNNRFTGGFGYALGINSAMNFTVQGNELFGNISFIGSQGPNCTDASLPPAEAFVVDAVRVTQSNIQKENMAVVPNADSLTCIFPSDGNFWPFGGKPEPFVPGETPPAGSSSGSGGSSTGKKIGLGIGIPLAILAAAFIAYFIRRWFVAKNGLGVVGGRPPSMRLASGPEHRRELS